MSPQSIIGKRLLDLLEQAVDRDAFLACATHLRDTRSELMSILAVNPVVQNKLAQECDRIFALGASCMEAGAANVKTREAIQAERAILKTKTIALSDLVAVFRALE